MDHPEPPQIVDFHRVIAVIDALSHDEVIEAMAAGFISYSRGDVSVPPIQTLGQPPLANFVGHPDAQALRDTFRACPHRTAEGQLCCLDTASCA